MQIDLDGFNALNSVDVQLDKVAKLDISQSNLTQLETARSLESLGPMRQRLEARRQHGFVSLGELARWKMQIQNRPCPECGAKVQGQEIPGHLQVAKVVCLPKSNKPCR